MRLLYKIGMLGVGAALIAFAPSGRANAGIDREQHGWKPKTSETQTAHRQNERRGDGRNDGGRNWSDDRGERAHRGDRGGERGRDWRNDQRQDRRDDQRQEWRHDRRDDRRHDWSDRHRHDWRDDRRHDWSDRHRHDWRDDRRHDSRDHRHFQQHRHRDSFAPYYTRSWQSYAPHRHGPVFHFFDWNGRHRDWAWFHRKHRHPAGFWGCHPVVRFDYYYGRPARLGATMCHGPRGAFILPSSLFVIAFF